MQPEVAKLVLAAAKIAFVVIPALWTFGTVHSWFGRIAPRAMYGELAATMLAGACALAVFRFCFAAVSRRE